MENHTFFQKQDYIEHIILWYAIFHSLGCFKYISTAKSTYIIPRDAFWLAAYYFILLQNAVTSASQLMLNTSDISNFSLF